MLGTITFAGGITTLALAAYLWFLPARWWAMFCQQRRWVFDAVTVTTDLAATDAPATRASDRLLRIAVEFGQRQEYPLLGAVDQARGSGHRPFAEHANAANLERYAQQIVDQSWSEWVWLTGRVDKTRFAALRSSFEMYRPISDSDVELMVVRELPSGTIPIAR